MYHKYDNVQKEVGRVQKVEQRLVPQKLVFEIHRNSRKKSTEHRYKESRTENSTKLESIQFPVEG